MSDAESMLNNFSSSLLSQFSLRVLSGVCFSLPAQKDVLLQRVLWGELPPAHRRQRQRAVCAAVPRLQSPDPALAGGGDHPGPRAQHLPSGERCDIVRPSVVGTFLQLPELPGLRGLLWAGRLWGLRGLPGL